MPVNPEFVQQIWDTLPEFGLSSCAGAVGGLVGGINTGVNNGLRLFSYYRPNRNNSADRDRPAAPGDAPPGDGPPTIQIGLGFVGDLIVGAAAGIAIVFFINLTGNASNGVDPIHLVPISLMVGVVSKKALLGMSDVALRRLFSEQERLRDEHGQLLSETERLRNEHGALQAEVKKLDHLNELLQEGQRYLAEGEEAQDPAKRFEKFKSAEATFLEATEYDHGHSKAYVFLGKALKRLSAETNTPGDKKRLLQQANDAVTEAIKLDSHYERAFYNRACYRAALGAPAEAILEDLKQAIELYPLNKVWARQDADFSAIQGDPRFQALIGSAEAAVVRAGAVAG